MVDRHSWHLQWRAAHVQLVVSQGKLLPARAKKVHRQGACSPCSLQSLLTHSASSKRPGHCL